MLDLFRKMRAPAVEAQPDATVPEGVRVYAIGDVHGRLDLLNDLLAAILADHDARAPMNIRLVFLGDLIDRGFESAEVVERVRLLMESDTRVSCIMGNHEEVLLLALDGNDDAVRLFTKIGGRETLYSYGFTAHEFHTLTNEELIATMNARVPPEHIAFLRRLEDQIEIGDYLFVHAGIRPGVALGSQKKSDLRWIREPFLSDPADHGKVVIHGHTVTDEVQVRANRIGIDTGAFKENGKLTAIGLEGGERWFLSATDAEGEALEAKHRQAG